RSAPLRDVVLLSCTCPLVILTSSSLFNDTPTTKIYTLSLHDALPIFEARRVAGDGEYASTLGVLAARQALAQAGLEPSDIDLLRSEEHTSELQSRENLVCRLLLEKKKT